MYQKHEPPRPVRSQGVNVDQVSSPASVDIVPNFALFQAQKLRRRFGLTPTRAQLVAALAWWEVRP